MIKLTDKASEVIKKKIKEQGLNETAGIRFSVKGGGCSGFSYDTSIVTSKQYDLARSEEKFIVNGIRILVDKKSALFLSGLEVDYIQDDFNGNFTYSNPNSKGSCGCGISFTPY